MKKSGGYFGFLLALLLPSLLAGKEVAAIPPIKEHETGCYSALRSLTAADTVGQLPDTCPGCKPIKSDAVFDRLLNRRTPADIHRLALSFTPLILGRLRDNGPPKSSNEYEDLFQELYLRVLKYIEGYDVNKISGKVRSLRGSLAGHLERNLRRDIWHYWNPRQAYAGDSDTPRRRDRLHAIRRPVQLLREADLPEAQSDSEAASEIFSNRVADESHSQESSYIQDLRRFVELLKIKFRPNNSHEFRVRDAIITLRWLKAHPDLGKKVGLYFEIPEKADRLGQWKAVEWSIRAVAKITGYSKSQIPNIEMSLRNDFVEFQNTGQLLPRGELDAKISGPKPRTNQPTDPNKLRRINDELVLKEMIESIFLNSKSYEENNRGYRSIRKVLRERFKVIASEEQIKIILEKCNLREIFGRNFQSRIVERIRAILTDSQDYSATTIKGLLKKRWNMTIGRSKIEKIIKSLDQVPEPHIASEPASALTEVP